MRVFGCVGRRCPDPTSLEAQLCFLLSDGQVRGSETLGQGSLRSAGGGFGVGSGKMTRRPYLPRQHVGPPHPSGELLSDRTPSPRPVNHPLVKAIDGGGRHSTHGPSSRPAVIGHVCGAEPAQVCRAQMLGDGRAQQSPRRGPVRSLHLGLRPRMSSSRRWMGTWGRAF